MAFISIYITNSTEQAAEKIIYYLMERKLVACANIYPIKSIYWWKGEIQKDDEWVALVKTTTELWTTVKEIITEQHPYEVPCIMKTDVEANVEYEEWIRKSVTS